MATGIGSVSVTVDNVRLNDYFHAEDKSKIGPNKVRTPLTVRVLRVSRALCVGLCTPCADVCPRVMCARDVRS